jgi:hypothetical protein
MWSIIPKEKLELRMFESNVLRKIHRPRLYEIQRNGENYVSPGQPQWCSGLWTYTISV